MMQKLFKAGLLILNLLLLSGCYEALNINYQAYPLAVGIDRGEEKLYRGTFVIESSAGGGDSSGIETQILTSEGDTLFEIKSALESALPGVLNFSHTRYLVFSEEVARSETMAIVLTDAPRFLELRGTHILLIAKDSAERFLTGLLDEQVGPERVLDNFMRDAEETGRFPFSRLEEYYESMFGDCIDTVVALGAFNEAVPEQEEKSGEGAEEGREEGEGSALAFDSGGHLRAALPNNSQSEAGGFLRTGGLASEVSGCALFLDSAMVGELDATHTKFLQIGRGSFHSGGFTIHREDGSFLAFRLTQRAAPSLTAEWKEGAVQATFRCYLLCEIYTGRTGGGYEGLYDENEQQSYLKEIRSYLENGLSETFRYCCSLGCDPFGVGRSMVGQYATIGEWKNSGWRQAIPSMQAKWELDLQVGEPRVEFVERPDAG